MPDFDIIVMWLIVIVCGGGFIAVVVWGLLSERKKRQKLLEEMEQPLVKTPLAEQRAIVVEKFCQRVNRGTVKLPNTREQCFLVLKTSDEKCRECAVSLDEYCIAKVGQEVTVAFENDKIFDINFD